MEQGDFIGDYKVVHSIRLDGQTHVVAENTETETEHYRVYKVSTANALGLADCTLIHEDSDFLKAMREFLRNLGAGLDTLGLDRTYRGSPDWDDAPFTAEDCFPYNMEKSFEGQVVAVQTGILSPEYRAASHQLHLATGGFGCYPDARGRTVYCTNIYDGEKTKFHRANIIGIVKPERIPEWAREKLAKMQEAQNAEKPSVVEEIKQSKTEAKERPAASTNPKSRKKSEPDL